PYLATWIDVGDSWEKTQGLGGYDMMVLKLTNSAIPGPKPKLFAMSAVHAREYTTAELSTRFAEYLVNSYGVDPDVTWILDHHEIHLLLQANPDGRKKAEQGMLWRKNIDNNFCSNTNNRGIDLNRNFEFQWGCCRGSSGIPCSETFRGPSPASEPETQAIQAYVRSIFPDERADPIDAAVPTTAMGVFLDIHSYSELVLWPWGFTREPTGNGTELQTLGRKLAYFNDYSPQQAIELYPTDGTTDSFAYGELGLAAYTFELGTAFFEQCSTFENTILPDNLPALLYATKVARTPYMTPAGPDALDVSLSSEAVGVGNSVTLQATLDDTRFNNGEGTEPTQPIAAAEYYVDVPPWDGGVANAMMPADGAFNSDVEEVRATIDATGLASGRHLIYVRGQDSAGNWGAVSAAFLYVTDPATPTRSPTATDVPGPTVTPTVTVAVTDTPDVTVTPTASGTAAAPTPSVTYSPTPTATGTVIPPVPEYRLYLPIVERRALFRPDD
ncbi:MAG: M14 family metallopeptidase, partial [Chloroflexota bacterium]|nr:M14 family metallopeptidase [Chloroflexota bacterium]